MPKFTTPGKWYFVVDCLACGKPICGCDDGGRARLSFVRRNIQNKSVNSQISTELLYIIFIVGLSRQRSNGGINDITEGHSAWPDGRLDVGSRLPRVVLPAREKRPLR
jgi:hypothetical protein